MSEEAEQPEEEIIEKPEVEKTEEEVAKKPRSPIPPDTILIGQKPVMSYVTAVMMHFNSGAKDLTVKARGRAISRAVDVIQVVQRRFLVDKLQVGDIEIGTDIVGEAGDTRNVSTIEIKVKMVE